jgi:GNAT superfamily N-acetyltransferase
MTLPDAQKLYAIVEGTWPAAAKKALGPWMIRLDGSGSSRVSAATAEQPVTDADIDAAAQAMITAGQTPLFMIREGEDALDSVLAARGYAIKDPVNMYAVAIGDIASSRPPPVTSFAVWPPLAVQAQIWAAGGIGQGRIAVMDRARQPKTTLLGRVNDRPAGTVYVGMAGDCAMIHALEISKDARRKGLARHLTVAAAFWAKDNGAKYLTLVTTQANDGANALYTSLGMMLVGQYHYRILRE